MSDNTPTYTETLAAILDSRIADVHTALPCEVVSYTSGSQTVSVRPMVRRPVKVRGGTIRQEDLPVLQNVPVAFLSAGPYRLTFPIAAGSTGLLVFSERDMSEWRRTGDLAPAGDLRVHSLASAVFFPGLHHTGNAPDADASAMLLGHEDASVRLTASRVEVAGSADAAALASKVDQLIATFNTHVHPAPGGTTSPTGTTVTGSSASAKLKIGS